jgi:hypothetical protein
MSRDFANGQRKATSKFKPVAHGVQIPRCAVCSGVLNLLSQVGILPVPSALPVRSHRVGACAAIALGSGMSNPRSPGVGSKHYCNITSTAGSYIHILAHLPAQRKKGTGAAI